MNGRRNPWHLPLAIACPSLAFAVMFGHLTAIVNVSLALTGIGLVCFALTPVDSGRRAARFVDWPLWVPIVLWAGWSLAAVAWSPLHKVSFAAWLDEVVYPLLTFWAFWVYGSRTGRPAGAALAAWVGCFLLAVLTIACWGKLQPPTPETFPLKFYARVGHTSTLALFAAPLFIGLFMRRGSRWLAVSGLLLCTIVGIGTLNRFFWPAFVVTLSVALFPWYRNYPRRSLLVFVLAVSAGFLIMRYAEVLRFGAPPVAASAQHSAPSAAVSTIDDVVSNDTRPLLWAFYTRVGMAHPWRGVGFGKPVPGIVYRGQMPANLVAREPNAPTHAHNLIIDTWLQTGAVGVALELLLFAALARRLWQVPDRFVAFAGVALVLGMIAKNVTDDFMWKTTMLAFWAFAGLLLGFGERAVRTLHDAGGKTDAGTVPAADARLKILFHINDFGRGGTETALLAWLNALDRNVFAPSVAVTYPTDDLAFWQRSGLPADVPVHVLAQSRWMVALHQEGRVRRLRTAERLWHKVTTHAAIRPFVARRFLAIARDYDLVCDFDLSFKHIAGRGQTPWIGVSHYSFAARFAGKAQQYIAKRVRQFARYAVLAVLTPDMLREAQPLFTGCRIGLSELPNVIDLRAIRERGQAAFERPAPSFIVSVARLDEGHKDHATLLHAYAKVRSRQPSAPDLALIGEGPDRERLETLAEALGIRSAVHFVGFCANPFPYVRAAELLVLSSRSEGFGMVLAEAMALGTPVLSADCPTGPRDLLDAGAAGVLVAPGDPDAMADGIERLLTDTELRRRVTTAAARKVQMFSPEQANRRMMELAHGLCGRGVRTA
jgi:glycosyltransferase involved in cell wall biosynthesis/O-antigen ligase